jgi:hypothetical protein
MRTGFWQNVSWPQNSGIFFGGFTIQDRGLSPYPYANHVYYGIFTYMTGWFWTRANGQVNIPAPWILWL